MAKKSRDEINEKKREVSGTTRFPRLYISKAGVLDISFDARVEEKHPRPFSRKASAANKDRLNKLTDLTR